MSSRGRGKLLRNTDEISNTLTTLNVLLNDEETFHQVAKIIFRSIDEDGSGELDLGEVREFIDKISEEMGIEDDKHPDDNSLESVFQSIDADGDGSLDFDELSTFLKRVFILQRDEIAAVVKKNMF